MRKQHLLLWAGILAFGLVSIFVLPYISLMTNFRCCGAPPASNLESAIGTAFFWLPVVVALGIIFILRYYWTGPRASKIALIVILILNLWPVALLVVSPLINMHIAQERERTRIAQQQNKERLREVERKEDEFNQKLAAKGCITQRQFSPTDYPERFVFYMEKLDTRSGREYNKYTKEMQTILDQAAQDCANGIITPDQQRERLAIIPDRIIKRYKEVFGEQKFQEFDEVFKQKHAEDPEGNWY